MTNTAIDKDFLRTIVENDKEFEKELFEIFIDNANRNITKMSEAIKVNDNNAWYMASHALKGASASIGAFDLSQILEYAQKNSEDPIEKKIETLNKTNSEFARVIEFIKSETGQS